MKHINFKATAAEVELIDRISNRAVIEAAQLDVAVNIVDIKMDITAANANGCPLDLKGLLAAEKFDFVHDVYGIVRHISRRTGRLQNCFVPRFAK